MNLNALTLAFSTKLLPLIYAIIGFGLLITIHEFGHFIFCKIFNIHTPTFSIGMGPKLFEKKIGNTNFRLSALPLGGYVEIAGLAEVGQGEQVHAKIEGETSFAKKAYWKKLFVLSGGVFFNLIFAYIVYASLFFVGIPKQKAYFVVSPTIKTSVKENSALKSGDKIIAINNKQLSKDPKKLALILEEELIKPINENKNIEFNLKVLRDKKELNLKFKPQNDAGTDFIKSFYIKYKKIEGEYEKYPLLQAIKKGFLVTNNLIKQMVQGLASLVKTKSLKGAGGPIMILSKTFESAQRGIIPLLIFLAIISINLAIINILPIGALDGGQVLFATIEAIIRREIPEVIKMAINIASWVLLLSLILYLSYKDLLSLFTRN